MDYEVISDDLIRFADQQNLEKFDVMGHSLGGRAAMTLACRFPDRVDGVISVDSAPINEAGNNMFGSFTYGVLEFMHNLSLENITREEAGLKIRQYFNNKPQFVGLVEQNIDKRSTDLKWLVNVESLYRNFLNVPYFDETLRFNSDKVYHIVGGKSHQYPFESY